MEITADFITGVELVLACYAVAGIHEESDIASSGQRFSAPAIALRSD